MTMHRLVPHIQPYAWGSRHALAEFLAIEETGSPMAEAWFGAHPSGPALVDLDGQMIGLDELLRAKPDEWLGAAQGRPSEREMPFLLKILAIEKPLSLQLHPTREQARVGYNDENTRRISLTNPTRIFRDRNHKPEMICALSELDALCGFRLTEETLTVLHGIGGSLAVALIKAIESGISLRDIIRLALSESDSILGASIAERADATNELAARADQWLQSECPEKFRLNISWLTTLARAYPGDGGVAVATMLHFVRLQPGDALFLAAGNMHAYLHGMGIEIMANSDNVVRGGLTPKHVDPSVLTDLVDTATTRLPGVVVPRILATDSGAEWESWCVPVDDFSLSRVTTKSLISDPPTTSFSAQPDGPMVILCSEGTVQVLAQDTSLRLRRGQAVVVPPGCALEFSGHGQCFIAAPGAKSP